MEKNLEQNLLNGTAIGPSIGTRDITTYRAHGPFGLCGESVRHFKAEDIEAIQQVQASCSACVGAYTVVKTKDGRIHSGYERFDY
jgi:hypothetical protein